MPIVDKFVPPHPLNTAVLFLIFNRLDTTKRVFEAIKQAKPPRLYIAADGPRDWKKGEDKIVQEVREYVLNNIDWNCKVKNLFREKNLGCGKAVSEAITWFFENEEMGIILEDDCLPSQSFFWFCERMLNEFKNDNRVMMITGTNYMLDIREKINKDYFFSRHFTIWGWATWRRAWSLYDFRMSTWRNLITTKDISFISTKKYIIKHFENTFDLIYYNKIDTWDIQWVYTCLFNYGLCLTPSLNLISNIGIEGTHSVGRATRFQYLKTFDIESIDNLKSNYFLYPEYFYDYTLHREITFPAVRRRYLIKLLKVLGVYKIPKKVYERIK